MDLELIIDDSAARLAAHGRGHITVRGHLRNLDTQPHVFSASLVRYSLSGPGGESVRVCNAAPDGAVDATEVPARRMLDFQSELTVFGTPELQAGPEYRLTAALPDGSDRGFSAVTFLEPCRGTV